MSDGKTRAYDDEMQLIYEDRVKRFNTIDTRTKMINLGDALMSLQYIQECDPQLTRDCHRSLDNAVNKLRTLL